MNKREKRASEIIAIMNKLKISETKSTADLINKMKSYFHVSNPIIQRSIQTAIKLGWLKKGIRTTWGGSSPLLITELGKTIKYEFYSNITTVNADTLPEKLQESKIKSLGFVEIINQISEKIETVLINHEQQISDLKEEIKQLKDTINTVQIDENKIKLMDEKLNRVEEEITQGTEKLLQTLNILKGKD